MDYKTGKLHKIVRQFDKGNGRYEINGINEQTAVFLYRKKAEAFIPIPKGNYRINDVSDFDKELEVDNVINDVAVEFQIIYEFQINSSGYYENYPELDIAVLKINQIVEDINNIVNYLNSVGIKADSMHQTQILTPLEPLSVWYMNEQGIIDTLPIDSFNKKFKEIIAKMEELANEKANEKVEFHLNRLKEEIAKLKTELGQKVTEELEKISLGTAHSLEAINQKKKLSITEIEDLKNENESLISNLKNEALSNIEDAKTSSLEEIENKKNTSKEELESKMPEINNKINGVAGGIVNYNFIQDTGTKTQGQYYLDRNTGKLFQCIQTTSSTINSATFFKDVSLNGIVDRLENLIKIKSYTINTKDIMTVQTNIGTYVITEIGIPNFKNKIGIPNNSTIVSVSSAQSPGYCEYCTYNYGEDLAYVGNIVNSDNPRWVIINVAYI